MKWLDVVLLVLIGAYIAYVIFIKKKRGCSGNCSQCQGCSHKENQ